jgi:hypothetical protein
MKAIRYAIVPGDTEQQAVENARDVFDRLCEGEWPVYDYYRLKYDAPCDATGVHPLAPGKIGDQIWSIFEKMVDDLRDEYEGDSTWHPPGTNDRIRRYPLYNQHAGGVVCSHRLSDLITAGDHWVVVALCSY